MVGRRQFNIPQKWYRFPCQAIHRLCTQTYFFIFCGPTRYNRLLVCSLRFLYACLHAVIILFLHFISQIRKCSIQHQPIEIKSRQKTRSAEINQIKQMEYNKGTEMQTEGPKIRTGLLELRQISASCGSSYAGNLKFGAKSARKV